ncbi:TPA: hypothetical protein QDA74_003724 [Burkholderia territorii]|uniref:hypothetical protein n=1 Tax=Burkholderia territorii TaxID=1503055 RepID=UPI0011CCA046|nr:hypothetical protein [Burkholderia territorii]TXG07055.1 hypothetical protein FU139_25425 [Burkholderia territorii]HDR8859226.1 hypothetical protein [Burkholderia territorii]HDR8866211.1 hypothetical protein [Burkholderia territorii]HDR8872315.1 hypothetical protein [Burkholderia territorii]HDR8878213.1 hypothetical protein [Burkholderia territorii]
MNNKPFTLGDLRIMLAPLSIARRNAVLFALDTGTSIEEGVLLGWKEALRGEYSDLAKEIVRAQPRHLHLDYVFWEYLDNGVAAPLFGLEDSVKSVSLGRDFAELQALYDRMVWVDTRAEADDFKRVLSEVM